MTLTTAKWTLEQYHRMIEAGVLENCRVELLNGEIVEMAPEGEPHAYFSHEVAKYLGRLLGDRADLRQGKPITIPDRASEPEPDIAIVQPLGREYLQHHPYPANIFWLIEFSNTTLSKDLDPKAKLYAVAGIVEYWVMNLRDMTLVVMHDPINGEYRSQMTLTQGSIHPIAFPEVSIAVDRLMQ